MFGEKGVDRKNAGIRKQKEKEPGTGKKDYPSPPAIGED